VSSVALRHCMDRRRCRGGRRLRLLTRPGESREAWQAGRLAAVGLRVRQWVALEGGSDVECRTAGAKVGDELTTAEAQTALDTRQWRAAATGPGVLDCLKAATLRPPLPYQLSPPLLPLLLQCTGYSRLQPQAIATSAFLFQN
jgi:hypothetical protein